MQSLVFGMAILCMGRQANSNRPRNTQPFFMPGFLPYTSGK